MCSRNVIEKTPPLTIKFKVLFSECYNINQISLFIASGAKMKVQFLSTMQNKFTEFINARCLP